MDGAGVVAAGRQDLWSQLLGCSATEGLPNENRKREVSEIFVSNKAVMMILSSFLLFLQGLSLTLL